MRAVKDPQDLDEEHELIWHSIQTLLSCAKWAMPIVVTLLGTILSYAYSIDKTLSEVKVAAAALMSDQKATERDLQDKYSRHLSVHGDIKTRLDRMDDKH